MPLSLDGQFFPIFTADRSRYGPDDLSCMERVVSRLHSVQTSAERPGMLLGKIQSGKTKSFLGAIALAFDNGFDIAIILTKGTRALATQTLQRVKREFGEFERQDLLQIHDIMTLPQGLTGYELNQKLIFVAKKQSDNLDRLTSLFQDAYPQLRAKRVLLIDDEADYASIGFRNTQDDGLVTNATTRQIEALRALLPASSFLQVTATPYSLYLQPQDFVVSGIAFKPVRPAFTVLVPVHVDYVGSDHYFEQSQDSMKVASLIYQPVTATELSILRQPDRRRFRVEECLTSPAIPTLRTAICNFIVGGVLRRLQEVRAGMPPRKYSFLVHTEAGRAAHAWQEEIVTALNEKLEAAVLGDPTLLRELLSESYADVVESLRLLDEAIPSENDVLEAAFGALSEGWLMITKVNSERQVEALLDEQGQLKLRTPLNVFIGGQILDRGITVANLIGFFYGRKPQVYQQDTVLQHSRMFGFRPPQDLGVTRFYTEPQIYDAMRRMHESDIALRQAIDHSPDLPVIFIQRDARGQIVPCSPNKLLASNTTTLRPFKRILPVGFQSDFAVRTRPVVEALDALLADMQPDGSSEPFEMPLGVALDILRRIEPTLLMEVDQGYDFDWESARAALAYMSSASSEPAERGRVWCLVRRGRNVSRTVTPGSHAVYSDAPDTTRTEGDVARAVAIDMPMLMLIRQNGNEQQGWRGTPFYWPVIWAHRNLKTAIFANETAP